MRAYYNELDPHKAQWLRNLIAAGHIAPGVVDERSIEDVGPDEVAGFTQCHWFAGIGVWSYALRLAGWPDDRPVWTGSCPCQPFSAAGKGAGFADERHLWPAWSWLIGECRPDTIFGEQVASRDGLGWLDLVSADLEAAGYAIGAVDTCSAGHGAPHIRQRLRFAAHRLADAGGIGRIGRRTSEADRRVAFATVERPGDAVRLGNSLGARLERHCRDGDRGDEPRRLDPDTSGPTSPAGDVGGLGNSIGGGRQPQSPILRVDENRVGSTRREQKSGLETGRDVPDRASLPSPTNGFWRDADWLYSRDGFWRPVEPGTFPLAHGVAGRVGKLRAYGDAIDAQATAAFIRAYMDRGVAEPVMELQVEMAL